MNSQLTLAPIAGFPLIKTPQASLGDDTVENVAFTELQNGDCSPQTVQLTLNIEVRVDKPS